MNVSSGSSVNRYLCDLGLKVNDRLGSLGSLFCRISCKSEESVHINLVGISDLDGVLVIQQIIVSVSHRYASLEELKKIHRAVLFICSDIESEERTCTLDVHLSDHSAELLLIRYSLYGF